MSGRPPHLPRPVTATEGQNPPIHPFHPAPAAAALASATNYIPPPPPPGTSGRPPHLPRPVTATGGQNPPIHPFHPAPPPYHIPLPPPWGTIWRPPHLPRPAPPPYHIPPPPPPPRGTIGRPPHLPRPAPPPRPAAPRQDAPLPSVQNAPPTPSIPFAWFPPPAEQYNHNHHQQQQPPDLPYARPHQNYGLQGSSFNQQLQQQQQPNLPYSQPHQNYGLQGSSFNQQQQQPNLPHSQPHQNYGLQGSSFKQQLQQQQQPNLPYVPRQDAPLPSVQNAPATPRIPFAWFPLPAEQCNHHHHQQPDLPYARPHQNYGLQGSSFNQQLQQQQQQPNLPYSQPHQNYGLQGSSFHPPQGHNTMFGPPRPPLQQNWRSQSPLLREPQGGGVAPSCGAWSSQPLPRKRRLEDEECSDSKRIKRVTMQVSFIPILDFLDKYPPIEPYEFKIGSTIGSIPEAQTLKTTKIGQSVLDGYLELFEDTYAKNKSWGGEFDLPNMLVSEEAPLCVTINKEPKLEASISNSNKDLDQLVTVLVKPKYGENGKRPAYVDDFIARVKKLPKSKPNRRQKLMWIIRNHPLLVESAKRRLVLHEFYTFYKMLGHEVRSKLFQRITRPRYKRWHLLIAPKDAFISTVYWKGREHLCPNDHYVKDYSSIQSPSDENPDIFPFTSQDGYLAVLLRHLIVHGPHDVELLEVESEELDLIIAYYFEEFLPIFLDEISSVANEYDFLKEILATYADRRSVFRCAPG